MIAQGNALGESMNEKHQALKGRSKKREEDRPPFQGLMRDSAMLPRAAPWAIVFLPFQGIAVYFKFDRRINPANPSAISTNPDGSGRLVPTPPEGCVITAPKRSTHQSYRMDDRLSSRHTV